MSWPYIISTLGELAHVFGEEGDFPEDIGEAFLDYVESEIGELHGQMCELHSCQSPIEQQFFMAWLTSYKPIGWWRLHPQRPYKINGKNYRVDFLAVLSNGHGELNDSKRKVSEVIIECDGHDFHEKTKEQAKRDKARDRVLQSTGKPVLHFTGSEIYNDAEKCVGEVIDLLVKNLKEL